MEFLILGPLRVRSGNHSIDLGAPAQRILLALQLAAEGAPVSDDRLIDELWDDAPPPSAHHLLQVYVSRLRALLSEPSDEGRIRRDGAGYALRVRPGELDAERYVAAVTEARTLAAGRSDVAPGGHGPARRAHR